MNMQPAKPLQMASRLRVALLWVLLCFSGGVLGAEVLPSLRGTIQELRQDDGYITVSG
ncbi:MAG: hypothetical protein RLZZ385_336, partial [Pseudomonadota bacterium]